MTKVGGGAAYSKLRDLDNSVIQGLQFWGQQEATRQENEKLRQERELVRKEKADADFASAYGSIEEFKQKVSDSIKRNYELHPEIKERISKANSRKITFKCEAPGCPNYVKKSPAFAKNAEHHFCNTKCHGLWLAEINKGIPRTPEVRAKIKASMPRGENHPGWKGGISNAPYCEKFNDDLRERIRAFFNYECFMCGKTKEEKKRVGSTIVEILKSCDKVARTRKEYVEKSVYQDDRS